jgi:ArsR family transcriptional regulator
VVTAAVAPFVRQVISVDDSAEMLQTARGRLGDVTNVDLRQGELETLPIQDATLDAALLFMVLHYIPDVPRVLSEVTRVLKPGGKLLIVDMLPHDREEYQQQMGHVWLGFSEQQVQRYLSGAGLEHGTVRPLATDPDAKGPALFTATARRTP